MNNIIACRLCLAVDVKLFNVLNTQLQEIYEKLTNVSWASQDGRPHLTCYICLAELRKALLLKSRALKAESLLTQLVINNIELTQHSVNSLDRQVYDLNHGLEVSRTAAFTIQKSLIEDEKLNSDIILEKEDTDHYVKDFKGLSELKEPSHMPSDLDNADRRSSDSEDYLPLKNFSTKKKKRLKIIAEKREFKGFQADYAKELILTKAEQQAELLERAKSLNYLNSPYKCDLCYKGFVEVRAYNNHKEKHDERSGSHVCDVCRMRYRSAKQLRMHEASSHARRYQCVRCAHTAHTANQAREHEKWHSGYTYGCQLCGQKFRKSTSYLTHVRVRHATTHACTVCGDTFVSRHGLTMHRVKTHGREQTPDDTTEPSAKRFCDDCNVEFQSVQAWERHILTSAKHSLIDEDSSQCLICGERCSGPAVALHSRLHRRALRPADAEDDASKCRPVAQLPCEQCGANFVNKSKLQAHVKRMHLGLRYNKNIVCEVCGKRCTSNASLRYHQRTHSGERPYSCAACGKRFTDNNQLRIHTRTHTGERPYCCTACGKRFSQRPALNRHYRVHTGVKPYACQYCDKTFSQSNSLKLHVRTVHLKLPPVNRRSKTQLSQATEEKKTEDNATT